MKKAHLITFGLAGHGIETSETWKDGTRIKGHISGYDSPESFERALSRREKTEYPPLSGIPVLDKRSALRENPTLSIRSPLVDVDLDDGVIGRIDTQTARALLPGLSGGFDTLALHAIAHEGKPEPGPLDHVSLRDYVAWWRAHGARLGHMDEAGLRIVWEGKEEER